MSSQLHQNNLNNHCRVCSKALGKTKYKCIKYVSLLEQYLSVDLTNDTTAVHPEHFCNSCYLTAKKISQDAERFQQKNIPVKWSPHSEESCEVCDVLNKGGRPKQRYFSGRPTLICQHIRTVGYRIPQFSLAQLVDEQHKADNTCKICSCAANKPLETIP
ncbi:PREDICTED: V(D)J recombination-activating protein 1-like [Amphimedon queenslandica]|uniref:RAG1 importin-binding domain-containing protein n=1 Tax=Amphimedon queenslandica TaxID=400682 RepID=A0A1X7T0Z2_AMPQE|nr:PREDICTED: V(D)J recombination-activating protein 1-like [Amphimedon queenslandica]|eukprot:XP_011408434.1 PREDICTED: V(D)J recombination-activating protein 1-like [Amphimedon queenslandica]